MSTESALADQPSSESQSAPTTTAGQLAFDLACGIALPIICLYFDPIVFQASDGGPLLGSHIIVAHVAMGLGLLSLSAWLLIGWPPALLAGLLAGGAIFATLLGLVLLPFSLMGLAVLIGVLGFSPFLTAFVFWGNAARAYRRACAKQSNNRARMLAAVGLALSCAGPWVAQGYVTWESSRAIEMILSNDAAEVAQGISTLKRFRVIANFDRLVLAYAAEKDAERRHRLAEAYKELTGTEIDRRLSILRD